MSLVSNPDNIRLAMLGMVDGNGHPYSWSAIINGRYDSDVMAECGYPVIPQYLGAAPEGALGIPGVEVTHVWCDDPVDTDKVSRAALIPNTVAKAEDVIGHVDAVVVATDRGYEHVDRCQPFIDAGLPIFIDKPMTDNADGLRQFIAWHDGGKPLMSTSAMRYGKEFRALDADLKSVGDPRVVTISMAKSWERYGIHALEAIYPMFAAGGYQTISHRGTADRNYMHLTHACGVDIMLHVINDLYGAFGHVTVHGTEGTLVTKFQDTFFAFKTQLEGYVEYLRTGQSPVPFSETVELMKVIIGGIQSREDGGRVVRLEDISI